MAREGMQRLGEIVSTLVRQLVMQNIPKHGVCCLEFRVYDHWVNRWAELVDEKFGIYP